MSYNHLLKLKDKYDELHNSKVYSVRYFPSLIEINSVVKYKDKFVAEFNFNQYQTLFNYCYECYMFQYSQSEVQNG